MYYTIIINNCQTFILDSCLKLLMYLIILLMKLIWFLGSQFYQLLLVLDLFAFFKVFIRFGILVKGIYHLGLYLDTLVLVHFDIIFKNSIIH